MCPLSYPDDVLVDIGPSHWEISQPVDPPSNVGYCGKVELLTIEHWYKVVRDLLCGYKIVGSHQRTCPEGYRWVGLAKSRLDDGESIYIFYDTFCMLRTGARLMYSESDI